MVYGVPNRCFYTRPGGEQLVILSSSWLLPSAEHWSIRYGYKPSIAGRCWQDRFRYPDDCCSYSTLYLQATTFAWWRGLVSIPVHCIRSLDHISSFDGISRICEPPRRLCFSRHFMLFASPPILVSTSSGMDTSIYHIPRHSRCIRLNILLRSIQIWCLRSSRKT